MGSVLQDLRFGFRIVFRYPGLAAVALLSLAIGIGANTTIFSVANAVLLRPFPVKEPERLVVLSEINLEKSGRRNPTFAAYREWKERSRAFESMALTRVGSTPATLTGAREAVRVQFGELSADLFPLAGVAPVLGRSFLPEDSKPGYGTTIVLSHDFWQRQYGGDETILGQTVAIEGMPMKIIGVMPPGFWLFPWASRTDAWVTFDPSKFPDSRALIPVGRLKRGATVEQAQAEMETLFRRLAEQQPGAYEGWGIRVEPLQEWSVGRSRNNLYLLLGAVGFVLLIACANVANLLLSRASARQKEIAIRASVGARRLRLIRQLVTESVALALAGGVLGIILALWGIELFVALAPEWFPRISEIGIDTTVLGFTLGVSLLTGVLVGLAPALRASRPDLNESLKEAGGRSAGGSGGRVRGLLVVTEIALALVLLAGAGLMINSFVRLQRVHPGFEPENLLRAEIFLGGSKYWKQLENEIKRVTPEADVFYEQLLARAESLPGVVSASIGGLERMTPNGFRIGGRPIQSPDEQPRALFNEVSPEFFRTMGVPLLKGRVFSERDTEGSPWSAVVSESFARRYFPNEDPIGKVLYVTWSSFSVSATRAEDRPREIVGVVKDVRYWGPINEPPEVIYGSFRQHPWEYPAGSYSYHLWKKLILRTATDPANLAASVQRIVAELDKDEVAFDITTMEERMAGFVAPQRFWMRLFGIFAGLAIFLAVVGIYGVMSFSVNRRTHEIGVRMANGARGRDILRLIVGYGLRLTVAGIAIGVAGSLGLTRLIERYLYEVKPHDPMTLVIVALVLAAVALAATYIPARRAAKIDPMDALRCE